MRMRTNNYINDMMRTFNLNLEFVDKISTGNIADLLCFVIIIIIFEDAKYLIFEIPNTVSNKSIWTSSSAMAERPRKA